MTKMTDEELKAALEILDDGVPAEVRAWNVERVRAHIAALTAERDEECDGSQRGGEICGACAGCVRLYKVERDALRERVSALTAERDEARRIHAANVNAGIELAKEFNSVGGVGYEVDGVFIRARALLAETVALRERVRTLTAKQEKWVQCTTVSNECLGGCRTMLEHDRNRQREALAERDAMRAEAHAAAGGLLEVVELLTDDSSEPALDAARRVVAERDEAERALGYVRDVASGHGWSERASPTTLDVFLADELRERDALRERVRALEGRVTELHALRRDAEARLSAMRRRAGDAAGLFSAWDASNGSRFSVGQKLEHVARHIVGADAPAPVSEFDGLQEAPVCAESSTVEAAHKLGTSSEPTTAEAFAQIHAYLRATDEEEGSTWDPSNEETSLSLLERRMGATESALRELIDLMDAVRDGSYTPDSFTTQPARLALTDAPPVFTLEEVKAALVAELESSGNSGATYVDCCAGACDGLVRRLAALRK